MKKIALISTFCDTIEKQNVLKENILTIKRLGIDVFAISPIEVPYDIIKLCDYFFYTKENPILNWPVRAFTFWKADWSVDGFVRMHRNVGDYGWAALYQVKKMSQIALTYDYDLFYHLIYDLDIDDEVIKEITENRMNLVHSRVSLGDDSLIWEATLHFMVFDRESMINIEKEIELDEYLSKNGIAEDQVIKWKNKFNLSVSDHYIKDKIYYWEECDIFNYSQNTKYKMFIGKTDELSTLINSDGLEEHIISPNLRFYFYEFIETQNFKFEINESIYELTLGNNKMIEFNIRSHDVANLKITDNDVTFDYSNIIKEISRNLVSFDR
jgi:hypothetical protein